jgi:hypothetical protein
VLSYHPSRARGIVGISRKWRRSETNIAYDGTGVESHSKSLDALIDTASEIAPRRS